MLNASQVSYNGSSHNTFIVTNEMEPNLYITFELFVVTSVFAVNNEAVYILVSFP
jgi:hypothetical protein